MSRKPLMDLLDSPTSSGPTKPKKRKAGDCSWRLPSPPDTLAIEAPSEEQSDGHEDSTTLILSLVPSIHDADAMLEIMALRQDDFLDRAAQVTLEDTPEQWRPVVSNLLGFNWQPVRTTSGSLLVINSDPHATIVAVPAKTTQELGRGSFGTVLCAEVAQDFEYALKTVPLKSGESTEEMMKVIMRETMMEIHEYGERLQDELIERLCGETLEPRRFEFARELVILSWLVTRDVLTDVEEPLTLSGDDIVRRTEARVRKILETEDREVVADVCNFVDYTFEELQQYIAGMAAYTNSKEEQTTTTFLETVLVMFHDQQPWTRALLRSKGLEWSKAAGIGVSQFRSGLRTFPLAYVSSVITTENKPCSSWLELNDGNAYLRLVLPHFTSDLEAFVHSRLGEPFKDSFTRNQMAQATMVLIQQLSNLHSMGFVHRDVKPSNILVNTERSLQFVLADFSAVRRIQDFSIKDEGPAFTAGIGGPRFMAPEVRVEPGYSSKVDVFAVAASYYFALSMGDACDWLSDLDHELPKWFRFWYADELAAIRTAMHPLPERRSNITGLLDSVGSLVERLERAVDVASFRDDMHPRKFESKCNEAGNLRNVLAMNLLVDDETVESKWSESITIQYLGRVSSN